MGCTQSKSSRPQETGNHSHKLHNPQSNLPQIKQSKAELKQTQKQILSNSHAQNQQNFTENHQKLQKNQFQQPQENLSQKNIKHPNSKSVKQQEEQNKEYEKYSQIQSLKQTDSNLKNLNSSKIAIKNLGYQNENEKGDSQLPIDHNSQEANDQKNHHKSKTNLSASKHSLQQNQINSSPSQTLQKSKDLKKQALLSIQKIQDDYLGVESRVEQHILEKQVPQNISISQQQLDYTTYHAQKNSFNESKKLNESQSNNNKKPFAHNLFYSQHQIDHSKKGNPTQEKQPEVKTNLAARMMKRVEKPQLDGYFQAQSQKLVDKSTRSQVINNLPPIVQTNNKASPKNTLFSKKNEFYSVLQNKKDFNYNYEEVQQLAEQRIPSKKSIKHVKIAEKQEEDKEKMEDFLIEETDQEGAVRVPIQSSYHVPSKRTIEGQSRKDVLMTSGKIAGDYLNNLQRQIANNEKNVNFSNSSHASILQYSSYPQDPSLRPSPEQHSLRKQSKLDTACFKQSSDRMRSSQKQNSHLSQSIKLLSQKQPSYGETALKTSLSAKKRAGPIMFSDVSFKQKDDSDVVHDEERYSNGLQMSVHLNVGQGYL